MNLEKRVLKNVLRGGFIAHQPLEEPQQVIVVTPDEHFHRAGLAGTVGLQEFVVGAGIHGGVSARRRCDGPGVRRRR